MSTEPTRRRTMATVAERDIARASRNGVLRRCAGAEGEQ